jgi:hypothetical protein
MKILRNTDAVMGATLIVAPEDAGPAIGASACELRHGIMHFCPDSPTTDIEESAWRRKLQRCLVTFVLFPSWAENQGHYSDDRNQAPKSQKKVPKEFSHNSMLH